MASLLANTIQLWGCWKVNLSLAGARLTAPRAEEDNMIRRFNVDQLLSFISFCSFKYLIVCFLL